jgi:hypothetical protein
MEEKSPQLPLLEPVAPEHLLPANDWALWGIGAAILLIFIALIIFLVRRKSVKRFDPVAARISAYQTARKSLDEVPMENARDTAVKSSLIIRRYLVDAAGDPSLFETHDEFVMRENALAALPQPVRAAAASGFTRFAALKYSAEISLENPQAIVEESKRLLETLHGGFVR